MIDLMVKIPSRSQAINRLRALGLSELLAKDEEGNDFIVTASHDVAVKYFPDLMVTPGVYNDEGEEITPPVTAGPHLMIRLLSDMAMAKMGAFYDLPVFEVVTNPGTVGWAD